MQIAVGATSATAVPVVVHKFPSIARTTEPTWCLTAMRGDASHDGGGSGKGMRVPRPRGICLPRRQSKVKVLHRRKDGKIELIEVP